MQFDVQENPTNYIIDEEDGQLMIRTTYSGKEAETQVAMNLMDGTDGIAAMAVSYTHLEFISERTVVFARGF